MPDTTDYLAHLGRESRRFREALAGTPGDNPVPTCPDWNADDLLWHLGEVQWFWGELVEHRITDGAELDDLERDERPGDHEGLLAFYDRASERLQRALQETPPETEVWMWAEDHSAAYIARRQAHEALIHRLDAELTAGERTAMDPALCADGVDEALRIMRGVDPDEGYTLSPLSGDVAIECTDVAGSWTVTPSHVTGTDPETGEAVDTTALVVRGGEGSVVARIRGTAADLDCWAWNRPPAGSVVREGDSGALEAVDRVVSTSVD